MKAYSIDLREKIVRAYDEGLGTQREIAEMFGTSLSFVEKLLSRWRETGQIAAKAHGGGRKPACNEKALLFIGWLVREQPDATLEELCERLRKRRGIKISLSTMCLLLKRLGLPRKKRRFMPVNVTRHGSRN